MNLATRKEILIAAGVLVFVVGVCLICSASGGLALMVAQERLYPAEAPAPVVPDLAIVAPEVDVADEYHRGAYDTCLYLYVTGTGAPEADAIRDCNRLVKLISDSGWYEQASQGYEKP